MKAFILLVPLLFIRYGLLVFVNKKALDRASHYPPFLKNEQIYLLIYQLCTVLLLIAPLFLRVQFHHWFTYVGSFIYLIGIVFLVVATVNFSKPNDQNLNMNGLYKYSRNPMYVGYFLYFLGCVLLTYSILLFIILVLFQVSGHGLILAEERWCIEQFGNQYKTYAKRVRRYL